MVAMGANVDRITDGDIWRRKYIQLIPKVFRCIECNANRM